MSDRSGSSPPTPKLVASLDDICKQDTAGEVTYWLSLGDRIFSYAVHFARIALCVAVDNTKLLLWIGGRRASYLLEKITPSKKKLQMNQVAPALEGTLSSTIDRCYLNSSTHILSGLGMDLTNRSHT